MKKVLALSLVALLASPAFGQVVTTPNVAALVCANNTVVPTPTSGQFFYVQCDSSGNLITTGGAAAGITVGTSVVTGGTAGQVLYTDGSVLRAGGAVKSTSLALGGATIGSNALAVTGTAAISGLTTIAGDLNVTGTTASQNHSLYNRNNSWDFNINGSLVATVQGGPSVVIGGGTGAKNADYLTVFPAAAVNGPVSMTIGSGSNGASAIAELFLLNDANTFSIKFNSSGNSSGYGVNSAALATSAGMMGIAPFTGVLQFGAADAAVAVAQTLRVQSVVAGTAAANGANWTLIGSLGTGTGTPGSMTFQVGVAQASGTAQSTATTALQLVGAANGSLPTVLMPGLANTATTSAVCYNTSTGLLTYDGTIGTCNTSTMRVKHDIVPLQSSIMLAGVMKMRPDSFFYNADQRTPGQQLGLMAEDLEAIDPRLVSYDDGGKPNAIRYLGPMFSYLVGAIQAQQAEINELKHYRH